MTYIGYSFSGTYTGYTQETRDVVISQIISGERHAGLERVADHPHFTWYDFSEDQKTALQTGGRASVITSTFGAWVKDTLKLLRAEAKAVLPKYRASYFSGLLCIKWNGESGGSIVFVSDAGIVSEPFRAVNVERELDARITNFKALADWMETLQPDRLDIIGYRNNYARFNYGLRDSGDVYNRPDFSAKPIASAAFGPMSLLWQGAE